MKRSKDKILDRLNEALERRGIRIAGQNHAWKGSWRKGGKKAIRILNKLKEEERL